MKINFSQGMKTTLGKPLMLDDGKTQASLGDVVGIALSSSPRGEQLTPEESYRRGKLAQRVMGARLIEVSIEDLAAAKKAVGQFWSPGVVAPAWDSLEGTN